MQFGIRLLQLGSDHLSSLRVSEIEHKIDNVMWLQNVAIQREENLSVSKKKIRRGEGNLEIEIQLTGG